jgi:hypothetical protein
MATVKVKQYNHLKYSLLPTPEDVIEFNRGRDKKKRKRRRKTFVGQSIKRGAAIGAVLGTGLAANSLYKNRKVWEKGANALYEGNRSLGMGYNEAAKKAKIDIAGAKAGSVGLAAARNAGEVGALSGLIAGGTYALSSKRQRRKLNERENKKRK